MATIASLSDMTPTSSKSSATSGGGGTIAPSDVGGASGSSVEDGLGQIDAGAGTVRGAVGTAVSFLGGGLPPNATYKKGGYVKSGKINLGSGRVSTTSKNKSNSNW